MFNIVLYQPEIPPNTGNIIRLAANSGSKLHLIKPLGFELDAKKMRRAGLDYHALADVTVYENYEEFLIQAGSVRLLALTTKATRSHADMAFQAGDYLMFGPETRGLPSAVLNSLPDEHCLRIPMVNSSRSLNLSNAVAIVVYEAWRQSGFA